MNCCNLPPHYMILHVVALVINLGKTVYATRDNVDSSTQLVNNDEHRRLGRAGCVEEAAWHPTYSAPWNVGYCQWTVDCDSPVSFQR